MQQLVAISRAMAIKAKVLILDEPTSSLDANEVEGLFRVIRTLRDQGVAILFVSHFLDQVYAISDRLTVLRNGQYEGEYLTRELDRHGLISKMIGKDLDTLKSLGGNRRVEERDRAAEASLMSVSGLGRRGSIEPTDLEIHPGEVVGFAGLLGAGRTELARLLYGADRPDEGEIRLRGARVDIKSPADGLDKRIAFSTENRRDEGIIGDLTVRENIILAVQAKRGWARPLPRKEQDEIVERYITALNVRPADPDRLIRNLSGGNQQKVLLGRWLATKPDLLILDEPTRGIDVGAKAEIQETVAELAEDGVAVVFISSELEEVVRLCERIVVLKDHQKIGEIINGPDVTAQKIVDVIAAHGVDAAAHSTLVDAADDLHPSTQEESMSTATNASWLRDLVRKPFFWGIVAIFALLALNVLKDPTYLALTINPTNGNLVGNVIDILRAAAPIMMIAVGMSLVIATGGIDLSVGSLMAVAGAVAMEFLQGAADSGSAGVALAAVGLALIVAAVLGAVNGILVAYVGLQPFISTLMMMLAGRGIAKVITGGQNTTASNDPFRWIANGYVIGIPVVFLLAVLIVVVVGLRRAPQCPRPHDRGDRHQPEGEPDGRASSPRACC